MNYVLGSVQSKLEVGIILFLSIEEPIANSSIYIYFFIKLVYLCISSIYFTKKLNGFGGNTYINIKMNSRVDYGKIYHNQN